MNRTEIIVKEGSKYFFTTSSYNAENPLGVIKATLKEYLIYKTDNSDTLIGRLYKTDDGNWYDLTSNDSINTSLVTSLKVAIDNFENTNTPTAASLFSFGIR